MSALQTIFYFLIFLSIVSACESNLSNISLKLSGRHTTSNIDFDLNIFSGVEKNIELNREFRDSIRVICHTHKLTDRNRLNLHAKETVTKIIILKPDEPYKLTFNAKVSRVGRDQIKIDFGNLGYVLAHLDSKVGLAVKLYESNSHLLGESEGIASNFIEIILDDGKVVSIEPTNI